MKRREKKKQEQRSLSERSRVGAEEEGGANTKIMSNRTCRNKVARAGRDERRSDREAGGEKVDGLTARRGA